MKIGEVFMLKQNDKKTSISKDQLEMRQAFLGGFAGQLVSGIIWIISSALSVLFLPTYGMLFLFFASMAIFPLTQLTLRIVGRSGKVSKENGLWTLGSQIAFIVPINFILVGAIIIYEPIWFYPAAMIVIGAHYIPFITLYGMKMFGLLSGLLIVIGTGIGLYGPNIFSLGGWITGLVLIVFAFLGRTLVLKEEK